MHLIKVMFSVHVAHCLCFVWRAIVGVGLGLLLPPCCVFCVVKLGRVKPWLILLQGSELTGTRGFTGLRGDQRQPDLFLFYLHISPFAVSSYTDIIFGYDGDMSGWHEWQQSCGDGFILFRRLLYLAGERKQTVVISAFRYFSAKLSRLFSLFFTSLWNFCHLWFCLIFCFYLFPLSCSHFILVFTWYIQTSSHFVTLQTQTLM